MAGGGPDTSAQDRLIAEQEQQLQEAKQKQEDEKKKVSDKTAKLMRRQLGGSLLDAVNQQSQGTLG